MYSSGGWTARGPVWDCCALSQPRRQRIHLLRRKLLFGVTIIAVVLCCFELAARVFWRPPDTGLEGRLAVDPMERWSLTPHRPVIFGGVPAKVNRHGYRGPDFKVRKPRCTYRIYATGDSSVFGHGVAEGEMFVALLPALLRQGVPPSLKVEAINGAVPGFSTYQSLARLEQSGWSTEPDLLLIANLWSDAAATDFPDRRYFKSPQGDPWTNTLAWVGGALDHCQACALIRELLSEPRVVDAHGIAVGRYDRVSTDQYGQNLGRMVRGIRQRGGQAVLVVLPHPSDQKHLGGAHRQEARDDFLSEGRKEMDQEHRQVMRDVARETNTLLVDLPGLVSPVREELFLDGVHPNKRGHALIAEELRRILLGKPGLFADARRRCNP